jgi:hypothetical protein
MILFNIEGPTPLLLILIDPRHISERAGVFIGRVTQPRMFTTHWDGIIAGASAYRSEDGTDCHASVESSLRLLLGRGQAIRSIA